MNTYLNKKFGLSNKVALLAGGGGAIGKAIALGLVKAGANVVISDYNVKAAKLASRSIEEATGKKILAIQVDITNSKDVEKMVNEVINTFGNIDILINSAGVAGNIPAEEMSDKEWNRVIQTNLTGTFFCCREVGKKMIKQKKGNIINIASMSGTIVNKGRNNAHYCASKGGVKMLTKALAAQWSKYNIRVNSISPGYIRTPLSSNFIDDPDFKICMESFTPMKRVGKPEELIGLAIFISSDASSFLTGADILIDGGYTVL